MLEHLAEIEEYLRKRDIPFEKPLWERPTDRAIVIKVPVSRVAATVEPGKTSRRQLELVAKEISVIFKRRIAFDVYTDQQQQKLETGLQTILEQRFADYIGRIEFFWHTANEVTISVEEKKSLSGDQRESVNHTINSYLDLAEKSVGHVHLERSEPREPSLPAILRAVKTIAPATIDEIIDHLENHDWHVRSSEWLNARIDLLRKKGLVLRKQDGGYVLSQEGLSTVPHGTSRSSSDVERALALGRAKW